MAHEHETWMLEESATGGTYCRACGQPVEQEQQQASPTALKFAREPGGAPRHG